MSHYVMVWLVLTCVVTGDEQMYCSVRYRRLCHGKGIHVACQFPAPGPGESCENYTQIEFTSDLQRFVTHYINRRRQRVAAGTERVRGGERLPKPAVMMQVEWDRELASLAQRLADQCNFVHDDCRATVRYPYAGQTVGEVRPRRRGGRAAPRVRRVLDAWWGERRRVPAHMLTTPFRISAKGTVWGHFTQLAVWTLRAVGCGAVRHGKDYPKLLLVCDFSHTNMLGQRTLVPGPLAKCPVHTARRPRSAYPLLCATIRQGLTPLKVATGNGDHNTYDSYDEDNTTDLLESPTEWDNDDLWGDISETAVHMQSRLPNGFREDVDQIMYRASNMKTTKGRMIDKLQYELESEVEEGAQRPFDHWRQPQPKIGRWREDQESVADSISENYFRYSTNVFPSPQDDVNEEGHSLRSNEVGRQWQDRATVGESRTAQDYNVRKVWRHRSDADDVDLAGARQRWQKPRDRPSRPGANALLTNVPNSKPRMKPQKSVGAPLKMDKDDEDQLFRDTGFKPRKQIS